MDCTAGRFPATGTKIANNDLTVVVNCGDGDCYGEGGNHFLAAIRRNPDMTLLVHNNQIYGLTKGQASPTSSLGMVTKMQTNGTSSTQFSALAIAWRPERALWHGAVRRA